MASLIETALLTTLVVRHAEDRGDTVAGTFELLGDSPLRIL